MNALKFPQNQMASPPSLLHKLNPAPLTKPPSTTAAAASRRSSTILLTSVLLYPHAESTSAAAFEFRLTEPEQSVEEAESGIQSHAQSLIGVKELLTAESWTEAQKVVRKSSALLKQDIYTMIQGKSTAERPRLRRLYSELFNAVTRLDYAARDKDRIKVWESYRTIVLSLHHIFSILSIN